MKHISPEKWGRDGGGEKKKKKSEPVKKHERKGVRVNDGTVNIHVCPVSTRVQSSARVLLVLVSCQALSTLKNDDFKT